MRLGYFFSWFNGLTVANVVAKATADALCGIDPCFGTVGFFVSLIALENGGAADAKTEGTAVAVG